MSKKICSNCRFAIQDVPEMFCLFRKLHTKDGLFENCHCFLPKILFDRITASPEVLAPKLVYWTLIEYDGKIHTHWMSTITGEVIYDSEQEAIAATVARLKEAEK